MRSPSCWLEGPCLGPHPADDAPPGIKRLRCRPLNADSRIFRCRHGVAVRQDGVAVPRKQIPDRRAAAKRGACIRVRVSAPSRRPDLHQYVHGGCLAEASPQRVTRPQAVSHLNRHAGPPRTAADGLLAPRWICPPPPGKPTRSGSEPNFKAIDSACSGPIQEALSANPHRQASRPQVRGGSRLPGETEQHRPAREAGPMGTMRRESAGMERLRHPP